MKWYKAETYGFLVREIEIEKETDKCVYVRGSRVMKIARYVRWFPTEFEAKDWLRGIAEAKIRSFEGNIKRVRDACVRNGIELS